MPLYEFRCRKCRKLYTVTQGIDEELVYPECHGEKTHQIYSFNMGTIDMPNGFDDGINVGLGKHFKSTHERDEFAKRHGMVKA